MFYRFASTWKPLTDGLIFYIAVEIDFQYKYIATNISYSQFKNLLGSLFFVSSACAYIKGINNETLSVKLIF